jgi:hypothetical protein
MRRIVYEYVAKGLKAPRRLAEATSSRSRLYWRHEPPIGEIKDARMGVVQLLAEDLNLEPSGSWFKSNTRHI